MKCYIILRTAFGMGEQSKEIKVRYIVIDTPYSYNMIIEHLTFNQLGVTLFTFYLWMKFPPSNGRVRVIQRGQEYSRKCYVKSLKLKRDSNYVREY